MGYRSHGKLADFGRAEPMHGAVRRTTRRVGDELLERTRRHTPIAKPPPGHEAEWLEARKRRPGSLRESWSLGELIVSVDGATASIEVRTFDPIAPYVEYPTLPHIIVPRRPGGMLRFWNALGETVYATIVHHTGTKGSYMLATALAEIDAMWRTIGEEEMVEWAREQTMLVGA